MEDYEVLRSLGRGASGEVSLARIRTDGTFCALKKVSCSAAVNADRRASRDEVQILKALRHPCVLQYYDSFESDDCLMIATEYVDSGDLQQLIFRRASRSADGFEAHTALSMFAQISSAMAYVHDHRVLHRDLKPSNVFLTSRGVVKIGDFGASKLLTDTTRSQRVTCVGSPCYMAPEVVAGAPYGAKADAFSLGVLLYELLSLRRPFQGHSLGELVMKISTGQYAPLDSPPHAVCELITELLSVDASVRPSVSEIVKGSLLGPYLASLEACVACVEALLRDEGEIQQRLPPQGLPPQGSGNADPCQGGESGVQSRSDNWTAAKASCSRSFEADEMSKHSSSMDPHDFLEGELLRTGNHETVTLAPDQILGGTLLPPSHDNTLDIRGAITGSTCADAPGERPPVPVPTCNVNFPSSSFFGVPSFEDDEELLRTIRRTGSMDSMEAQSSPAFGTHSREENAKLPRTITRTGGMETQSKGGGVEDALVGLGAGASSEIAQDSDLYGSSINSSVIGTDRRSLRSRTLPNNSRPAEADSSLDCEMLDPLAVRNRKGNPGKSLLGKDFFRKTQSEPLKGTLILDPLAEKSSSSQAESPPSTSSMLVKTPALAQPLPQHRHPRPGSVPGPAQKFGSESHMPAAGRPTTPEFARLERIERQKQSSLSRAGALSIPFLDDKTAKAPPSSFLKRMEEHEAKRKESSTAESRTRSASSAALPQASTASSNNANNNPSKPGSAGRVTKRLGQAAMSQESRPQAYRSHLSGSQLPQVVHVNGARSQNNINNAASPTPSETPAPPGFGMKSNMQRSTSMPTLSPATVSESKMAGSPSRALLRQPRPRTPTWGSGGEPPAGSRASKGSRHPQSLAAMPGPALSSKGRP